MKKPKKLCPKILAITEKFEQLTTPLLLLGIRFYMAMVFFKSGNLKLQSYLNNNWQETIDLFTYEHPFKLRADLAEKWGLPSVEIIPPNIAAVMGTGGEIIFSTLLVFGLMGRFAAIGLLFMTAVIEFTYMDYEQHYYWAMLLCVILVKGAGKFSLDNIILKLCCTKK